MKRPKPIETSLDAEPETWCYVHARTKSIVRFVVILSVLMQEGPMRSAKVKSPSSCVFQRPCAENFIHERRRWEFAIALAIVQGPRTFLKSYCNAAERPLSAHSKSTTVGSSRTPRRVFALNFNCSTLIDVTCGPIRNEAGLSLDARMLSLRIPFVLLGCIPLISSFEHHLGAYFGRRSRLHSSWLRQKTTRVSV